MDYREKKEEKKNKRRGFIWALFIHIVVVGLALLPFLKGQTPPPKPSAILMDFRTIEDIRSAAASQASQAPSSPEPEPEAEPEPEPEPEPDPVPEPEPEPDPDPEPEVVETTPPDVLTDPSNEPVVPVTETPKPNTEVKPTTSKPSTSKPTTTKPSTRPSSQSSSSSSKPSSSSGKSNDAPQTSSQGTGDKDDNAPIGEGDAFDDNAGDGIFNRKVIKRGNLNSLMTKNGKIVVDLCINPVGRVTYVDIVEEKSTIRDRAYLSQVERATKEYRFERDYSADYRQCGRMTFVVRIPKE